MARKQLRFDIGKMVDSGILQGKVTGLVWTGFPSKSSIGNFDISFNPKFDREYKNLLQELEDTVIQYRNLVGEKQSHFGIVDIQSIRKKIRSIKKELQEFEKYEVITDILFISSIITYENIMKNNPVEFKKIDKNTKSYFSELQKMASSIDSPISKLVFDGDQDYARVEMIMTEGQKKKFLTKSNFNQLERFVSEVSGIKNPSDNDIRLVMEEIGRSLYVSDAMAMFKNEDFAARVYASILYNYLFQLYNEDIKKPVEKREYPELSPEYIKGIDDMDELFELAMKYNYNMLSHSELHGKLQADYIINNIETIDIKKLFLTLFARILDSLDSTIIDFSEEDHKPQTHRITVMEEIDSKDLSKEDHVRELCKRQKVILDSILKLMRFPDNLEFKVYEYIENAETPKVTVGKIKERMKKFCGDFYLNDSIIEYIKRMILIYENKEYINDEKLLKRLNWKKEEILSLINLDIHNLKKLLELEIITKDDLKELIIKVKDGQVNDIINEYYKDKGTDIDVKVDLDNLINNSISQNIISIEELIDEYYVQGIIDDQLLEGLKLDEQKLKEFINSEKLIEVYREYSSQMATHTTNSNLEDESKVQSLKRKVHIYTELFNKYYLNGLDKEEKDNVKKELVEDFYLELVNIGMDDEEINPLLAFSISEMLNNNFIDFELIDKTSFIGTYITEFRKRNIFSLDDTIKIKELLGDDRFEEIIVSIIKENELSQNQKYALIMDFFFKNSDIERRDRLIKMLNYYSPDFFNNTRNGNKKPVTASPSHISDYDNTTETSNFQKHVYSDAIKWLVYHSIIDADVKTTIYSNGYVEFYCPRIGKRFFEKFYKIDKKTNKIISYEYGVATYVMDDNDYINNRQILVDQLSDDMEAINPVVLSELVPKGKKNRIPHITQSRTKNWIRQMVSEFGSIYSEKDQEELLVLEYENQHEIMD